MSKRNSSLVRVQGLEFARRLVSRGNSFTRSNRSTLLLAARLSGGVLALLLTPGIGAALPRITPGPAEPPPGLGSVSSVSVLDASMAEGNEGASVMRFKVTLTPESSVPVTLSYRLKDLGACCRSGDYQAIDGTVTIPAHMKSSEIPVTVYGDREREGDENFELVVTRATNAELGQGVAIGTIINDDLGSGGGGGGGPRKMPIVEESLPGMVPDPQEPPAGSGGAYVSVFDSVMPEGSAGPGVMRFRVSLSQECSEPTTVSYRLVDGTATCDDDDFQAAGGTVTIPAHRTSSVIAVTVFGDDTPEAGETFELVATDASTGTILRGVATGTIGNDDFGGGGGGSGGPPHRKPIVDEGRQGLDDQASFSLACANPVRGAPAFRFSLPRASHVSMAIFDVSGRMIGTPVEGEFAAGTHVQTWNQAQPGRGIYFAQLRTGDRTFTQRITWLGSN
jgi:Calx-beta domain-containing protein